MRKQPSLAGSDFRFRRLPQSAIAIAVLAACGVAHAQQDTTNDQTLEKITVTGSNLRRADTETPSPVQVITLEDLKNSGYTDVQDVLHNLAANGAGQLSQNFGSAFAAGASGVALRGLTVGSTLTLIDGHRVAPNALYDDGQRQFVDISQIPLEAIDRIEILKDGASSIYGSDAIAGVVNIILKKSYIGGEVSGDYGVSRSGDGRTRHVTGTYGVGDLDADGHNFYVAVEYREQDPIYAQDRSYLSSTNFTSQGGNNLTPGVPNLTLNGGFPGNVTGYFQDPVSGAITGFQPGCTLGAYKLGACTYNISGQFIQTPTQNIDVLASYTQNLGGGWQVNSKLSLFDVHTSTTEPYPSTGGLNGFLSPVLEPGTAPGLFPTNGNPLVITVPATYPGNKAGTPQVLVDTFNQQKYTSSEDSQNYRFATDLTGSVYGFDTTLSVGFSEDQIYTTEHGGVDFVNLYKLLNQPVNPYRVGSYYYLNTAAENNLVFPQLQGKATSSLGYVQGEVTRDLYTLPGGPLSLGVGFDYRHTEEDEQSPPLVAAGQVGGSDPYAEGNTNVTAVYAELAAPIFKWLEIDASARHDNYSGTFSNTEPKIGFKLSPIEQVTFRGTYSEGFRAPDPAEEGNSAEAFLISGLGDNKLCPNGNPLTPGNFPAYCASSPVFIAESGTNLKPEKSYSYTLGFILEPVKGYSVSVDYYSIKINNQIISASETPDFDVFSAAVRGSPILSPQVPAGGGTPVEALTTNQAPGAGFGVPTGPIAFIPSPYVNAAFTHTDGVDFDVRAKTDLWRDWGRLTFDFTESHIFQYVQQYGDGVQVELAGTHGPSGVSGDTGNPRDRAQFVVTYDRGPLTVTTTTNWTSGYDAADPTQNPSCAGTIESADGLAFAGATTFPSSYCRIKAFTTVDLYANYKLTKNLSVHASILNLGNASAPYDFATYGGGTNGVFTPYSPSFAQSGAVGRYYTVGAQYRF